MGMGAEELAARLLAMAAEAESPEFQQKLAESELARTDPYRWYCRICGVTGKDASRLVRNDQAYAHVAGCTPGREHLGTAEHGRLLHVWGYGAVSPLI